MTDFSTMSLGDLVSFYNKLATSEDGKAVGLRPMNSMKDETTAIKYIERAQSSIKARTEGLKAEARNNRKEGVEMTDTKTPAPKGNPKPAALAKGAPAKKAPAAKAGAKKPAAPAAAKKAPAAKADAKIGYTDPIFGKLRADSNRAKLGKLLGANIGSFIPSSKIVKTLYGDSTEDSYGPMTMVMKGLGAIISANRVKEKSGQATSSKGYEIRKETTGDEIGYGLFKIGSK